MKPKNPTLILLAALLAAFSSPISSGAADDALAGQEEGAIRAATESVAASVVQIRTIGGLDAAEGKLLADGPTTGLIISEDGYILSSSFNFLQQPASILVALPGGKQAPAELVATDHSRMTVLLKVSGVTDLKVPAFAPPDEIKPGQWAIAVGRTFRTDRVNVTVGIVSALNRMFGKAIQTDADVSAATYGGPLVDIRGRVLGIVVPMAPQGASQVAGAEWYDSGIGFAVPLAPLIERLEQMKKGKDLRSGILGVGMAPKSPHSSPPELAAVRPDSPAGKAGFEKGDRIVEIDGREIRSQTDMRFALGPKYAGESVRIAATRGDERIERTVKLIGELPPFRHAFLGILPIRPATTEDESNDKAAARIVGQETAKNDEKTETEDSKNGKPADAEAAGIVVRMVYPGGPAESAGIKPGDRIVMIAESAIDSFEDAAFALNNLAPASHVTLQVKRGDELLALSLKADRMPTSVPSELPSAYDVGSQQEKPENDTAAEAGEIREIKLPEFPQTCKLYVPASHADERPQGVLLWLHRPGEEELDDAIDRWRAICDRDGLLLVVPAAHDKSRWERTELEYLRRLTERILTEYMVDRNRVAVFGQEGGGAMAWLLGLASRDVFRGIATAAAPLPRQAEVPPNEPAMRTSIFAAIPANKEIASQIGQGVESLVEAGYPVVPTNISDAKGELTHAQREEIARWIDSLDRL